MKVRLSSIALGCTLFASLTAIAQAPPGAPPNATGQCKDGSYWTGSSKSGACRGHQGIQTWFGAAGPSAAPTTNTSAPPTRAVSQKPAPSTAPAGPTARNTAATASPAVAPSQPKPSPTVAPGGGPGLVWVNTSTKVYHCPGDRYYGKTKEGKYMSEADAKAMGAKADAGKGCSK